MATISPGGSIADQTGHDSEPTRLVVNPGWVTPAAGHSPYPRHHRSRPLKEMVP